MSKRANDLTIQNRRCQINPSLLFADAHSDSTSRGLDHNSSVKGIDETGQILRHRYFHLLIRKTVIKNDQSSFEESQSHTVLFLERSPSSSQVRSIEYLGSGSLEAFPEDVIDQAGR